MLEPETEDNVVYWNTMDAWIPRPGSEGEEEREEEDVRPRGGPPPQGTPPGFGGGRRRDEGPALLPIYKLMSPQAVPTRILEESR
jgi:hypothetical protein